MTRTFDWSWLTPDMVKLEPPVAPVWSPRERAGTRARDKAMFEWGRKFVEGLEQHKMPRLAEAKPTAIEVKPPSLVDEIAFIRRVISPALADVYAKTMLGSDAVREYGAAVPIPAVPPGEKSE